MLKEFLPVLLAVLCAVSPSLAQTQSDDVVRITTNLVQIDVVVTKNGKSVKDLKAEDFEIFEDGKLQTITSFVYVPNVSANIAGASQTQQTSGQDSNTPSNPGTPSDPGATPPIPAEPTRRTIAFVVDDYGLSATSMAQIKRHLRKFIDEKLKPNDLVAIIRTSRARRDKLHLTNDKTRLNQAWEQLNWHPCSRVGVKPIPRVGDDATVGCGGVATFDESISSIRTIVNALGKFSGRKSMIIFSNDTPLREDEKLAKGGSSVLDAANDSTSDDSRNYNTRLNRLAEMAIRSSVVIYGIDASGLQATHMTAADATVKPMVSGSEGNRLLVQELRARSKLIQSRRDGAALIAKQTGGFLVQDQNDSQLDKILDEQGGYYLIGYRPSTETFNKQFHKFKARVKKDGFEVRTRSGFFGISEDEAKKLKNTPKQ